MQTQTLRSYQNLGTAKRGEPCLEYPGQWIVFYQGNPGMLFASLTEAFEYAKTKVHEYDTTEQSEALKLSICWECSDDDPRVGKTWFTGFYQHGSFNQFGNYRTT